MSDADRAQRKLERIICIVLLVLFFVPFTARAQESGTDAASAITLNQVEQGSLLLKTSHPDLFLPATTVSTDIEIQVTGIILRARVTQTFRNPTNRCVEGVYLFPLPENAAVDSMQLRVGDRLIEGVIKEREEARKIYEEAKAEGRKASLLQQERPNVFTISVASLGANQTAEVTIEYQQVLQYEGGEYRMRLPLVVAPRYSPASAEKSVGTAQTADSSMPTPQSIQGTSPTTSLKIHLNAGVSLRDIASPRHKIVTTTLDATRYAVELADRVPSNRDFELAWKPDRGTEPRATILSEASSGEMYSLLMLVPPDDRGIAVRIPRETIFIIDTSGSMSGESIEQAREALLLGLEQLQSVDSFNVIEFNSVTTMLFDESQTADPSAIEHARSFVRSLDSEGGTEMLPALQAALATQANREVRQVIFITDGQVSNEQELFTFLKEKLGKDRLFTVGIGSAPNSYFMSAAARMGRGTFTYVGSTAEVRDKVAELFTKLENPVLTDITIESSDPSAEFSPALVPDLYLGEPLVVAVRTTKAATIRIRGRMGSRTWESTVETNVERRDSGISRLWARRKIEELMDSLSQRADADSVRKSVIDLALKHHLVSQYTSLVAVDTTPQSALTKSCNSELIPLPHPAGWDQSAAKGTLPQTGTSSSLLRIVGMVLIFGGLLVRRLL